MANSKPLVAVATACERVLREVDGVTSLIRLVDVFSVGAVPPTVPKESAGIKLSVVVSLKSGDLKGKHNIRLEMRLPDASKRPLYNWDAEFEGGVHGVVLRLDFDLPIANLGVHWIDVVWYGDILTSIPITLAMQAAASPNATAPRP